MPTLRRGKPLLGTFVEIGVLHPASVASMAATDAAFSRIARVQHLLSFHDPDSDLSRLNRARGGWVALWPLTVRVIRLAKTLSRLSHHTFNCTVGGTMVSRGLLPGHEHGGDSLQGLEGDIEIHGNLVRLRNGISLTLDGIAKGYAVDLAVAALKHHGIGRGWVNAGGDLRIFGEHTTPVYVRDAEGRVIPLGRLGNAAIASSRNIAAPNFGFRGEIVGEGTGAAPQVWAVIARHAWLADALTKVAANSKDGELRSLIESLRGHLVFPTS
jgi:FAD:protein FMN transferase